MPGLGLGIGTHAVGSAAARPAAEDEILAWYVGNDGNHLVDSLENVDPPKVGNIACLGLAGTAYGSWGPYPINEIDLFAEPGVEWTATMWMRASLNANLYGISRGFSSTPSDRIFGVQYTGGADRTHTPAIYLRGVVTSTSLDHDDGAFHHYAITWDGSVATLYADGVLWGELNVGTEANGEAAIEYGRMADAYSVGALSGLGLWKQAISVEDIVSVYNGRIPKVAPVSYLPCEDQDPGWNRSVTIKGYDGELFNSPTVARADDLTSLFTEYGFIVETQGVPPYLPSREGV